jgi:uncharacterized oxidoreductase
MQMTGNTIFITGGTSGIGLGLALRFAALGNTVIVGGRRKALLDQITAEHANIEGVELDVQDPASITAAFESVTAAHPDLNVVVNVAGIMLPENLRDPQHLAVAEATVATNLLGPIRVIAQFLPWLEGKPHAAILNVSSGLASVPLPITPTYNATKAAVHSFTEALRVQLAGTPVQVIELVPPAVRTTLMNQENVERAMPLEDYLDETLALLHDQPEAGEILVERVKPLRFAERDGTYDAVLTSLSAH